MSEYIKNAAISRSDLVLFRRSRREFRSVKDGILGYPKDLEPRSRQDTMNLGTATHVMALEPEKRGRIVEYDGPRRGAKWKQFESRNAGSLILTRKAYVASLVMGAAVRCQIGGVLSRAMVEHWIDWTEVVDGEEIRMKALLDIYVPEQSLVLDVKTTEDIGVAPFGREIRKWAYWLQDAHYSEAVASQTGCEPESVQFMFAAVSKGLAAQLTASCLPLMSELDSLEEVEEEIQRRVRAVAPLMCGIRDISPKERQDAFRKRKQLLLQYVHAVRSNDWSDPGEGDIKTCERVVE